MSASKVFNSQRLALAVILLIAHASLSDASNARFILDRTFPVEVGSKIMFTISMTKIIPSSIIKINVGRKLICGLEIKPGKSSCNSEMCSLACSMPNANDYVVEFIPKRSDYNETLTVLYYADPKQAVWVTDDDEFKIHSEKILLTYEPKDLLMSVNDETALIKKEIDMNEPKLWNLHQRVEVTCTSEGALPPADIMFSAYCSKRSPAWVEEFRRSEESNLRPVNIYYTAFAKYGITHPPSDDEIGDILAKKHAEELMSAMGQFSDKTKASFQLTIRREWNMCKVACSQGSISRSYEFKVNFPVMATYILPRPYLHSHRITETLTCYPDGEPVNPIEMRCMAMGAPMRVLSHEYRAQIAESVRMNSGSYPTFLGKEGALLFPDLSALLYKQGRDSINSINERVLKQTGIVYFIASDNYQKCDSNQVDLRGNQLTILSTASVGLELLLWCSADQKETFSRFVITNQYNASLGVVLGICCAILLLSMVVIGIMIMTKKRHLQRQNAFQARNNMVDGYNEKRFKNNGKMATNQESYMTDQHQPQKRYGGQHPDTVSKYGQKHLYGYEQDEDEAIMRPGQPGVAVQMVNTLQKPRAMSSFGTLERSPNHMADFGSMRPLKGCSSLRDSSPEQIASASISKSHSPMHHQQHIYQNYNPTQQQQQRHQENGAPGQQSPRQMRGSVTSLQPNRHQMLRSDSSSSQTLYGSGMMRGKVPRSITEDGQSLVQQGHTRQQNMSSDSEMPMTPKQSAHFLVEQQKREATDALLGLSSRGEPDFC